MPIQTKSLIFLLYFAGIVCGVCGTYRAGSEFKLSKLGFQELNKILISQFLFFDYLIIFRITKIFSADCRFSPLRPYVSATLCPCALMSLCPYVPVPLCPRALMSATLCPAPFVCALMSDFDIRDFADTC